MLGFDGLLLVVLAGLALLVAAGVAFLTCDDHERFLPLLGFDFVVMIGGMTRLRIIEYTSASPLSGAGTWMVTFYVLWLSIAAANLLIVAIRVYDLWRDWSAPQRWTDRARQVLITGDTPTDNDGRVTPYHGASPAGSTSFVRV